MLPLALVVGIGDGLGLPGTLVRGVVDEGSLPLAVLPGVRIMKVK